ncbi:MAG: flagellar export chaperone FliS [Cellvibrionaceae bacterium]|nr:flagellar export chaperone FliS [Cellvibrionaceae bacterium]
MSDRPIDSYRAMDIKARVESASAGELIALLFEGLITSLTAVKVAIGRGDLKAKADKISNAISILSALRESLNDDGGAEITYNLDRLYDYMQRKIITANQSLNVEDIDEVVELVVIIKSGWDEALSSS